MLYDSAHLTRLMKMCRMLGTKEGLTLLQIRGKCQTSRRTAFRDIRALEAMGIVIRRTKNYHYRISMPIRDCRKKIGMSQVVAINKLLDNCLK